MSASFDGVLLGICNPLLDISVPNAELELFDKFEIKPGNTSLAQPHHVSIYDDLVNRPEVEFIAGGAGKNSIRAAQWMLQIPGATTYLGSIGNDENGRRLQSVAQKAGVNVNYHISDKAPTGTCAVLIHKKERALVANLGAANHYSPDHYRSPPIQHLVKKAKIFYATGFFLTVSPEVMVEIGQHCAAEGKYFVMNISAPFLVDFFFDKMNLVLPYTDMIICNEHEAAAFAKKSGWDEKDLVATATKIASLPRADGKKPRTVIFTQGSEPTIVAVGDKVTQYPVPAVPKDEIVDTNGAGDSFVGGLLAGLVKGVPLAEAVAAGHNCAGHCIRRSGASYPEHPDFVWSI